MEGSTLEFNVALFVSPADSIMLQNTLGLTKVNEASSKGRSLQR
jgi:hypothetical protein